MSTPTPAALSAAEECADAFHSTPHDELPVKLASIIDRHMAAKPVATVRYFKCESYSYEWDGRVMWYLNPRGISIFVSPEELLKAVDAYETDEAGKPLIDQEMPIYMEPTGKGPDVLSHMDEQADRDYKHDQESNL